MSERMMYRLLLFDLDGTLLTSDETITPATAKAIKACKSKGINIGYITARANSPKNRKLISNLPCDFVAYYGGAEIYVGDKLIESHPIPYAHAIKMIRHLHKDYSDMQIAICMEPWYYSSKSGEILNHETAERKKCTLLELPPIDVQRILLLDVTNKISLQNYITYDSNCFVFANQSAIIISKNASKENAMLKASEYFNIPLAQMIAFGDDSNDIGMLKTAGISVAMGNAIAEVKDIADFVTTSNNDDGIAVWIEKYLQ